jgi:hypothetical protein
MEIVLRFIIQNCGDKSDFYIIYQKEMYVKKSEYAKTIARNKELEEQNEAQYYVIKNLLKENEEWKNRVKELE